MKSMEKILERIIPVLNKNTEIEHRSPMWEWCQNENISVEMTVENMDNMCVNPLTFGFSYKSPEHVHYEALWNLATSVGVRAVQNPEGGKNAIPIINQEEVTQVELLNRIESALGFDITIPIFMGGFDGLISDRCCHYLWVLKRIKELCPDRNSSILEIGAGLGILGYYLSKAGYGDYTTIDLAHANAIQTYFLSKNLPERNIFISGDLPDPFDVRYKDSIKILHASDFHDVGKNRFDLIINIDSLTEMEEHEARIYMQSDCAPLLLSINHEMNDYRIIDICQPRRELKYRYPFWVRDGYVEELYKLV